MICEELIQTGMSNASVSRCYPKNAFISFTYGCVPKVHEMLLHAKVLPSRVQLPYATFYSTQNLQSIFLSIIIIIAIFIFIVIVIIIPKSRRGTPMRCLSLKPIPSQNSNSPRNCSTSIPFPTRSVKSLRPIFVNTLLNVSYKLVLSFCMISLSSS